MNKNLSYIIFLSILVCGAFFSARAEIYGDYEYSDNGSSVAITGYYGGGGPVSIPSEISGKPVISIRERFLRNDAGVTSIEIPASVRDVGDLALACCDVLAAINVDENNLSYSSAEGVLFDKEKTTLIQCPPAKEGIYTIPQGVESLDPGFFDCEKLSGIVFSKSVVKLQSLTFNLCNQLTSFEVVDDNPRYCSEDGVLFNKAKTQLIRYPAGRAGSYKVPLGVTEIATRAFISCGELSSVVLPSTLLVVGEYAFTCCGNLTDVTWPENLRAIGYRAFAYNRGIRTVTLPATLTELGDRVFYNCSALSRIEFLGDAPRMGREVFEGVASDLYVYYQSGKTGYSSPTWAGHPCSQSGRTIESNTQLKLIEGYVDLSSRKKKKKTVSVKSVSAFKTAPPEVTSKEDLIASRSKSSYSVESMWDKAKVAELDGRVRVKDLLLDRDQYVDKVVRLRYSGWVHFYASSSGSSRVSIWDDEGDVSIYLSLPDDRDAREWAIDEDEDDYGASGSLYVYVGERSLLALGERKRKRKDGYEYSW